MDKFKYISQWDASKDLIGGGYILHRMAPGDTDRFDDYKRCHTIDTRFARTMALTQNEYQPIYENWYGIHFPMLHVNVMADYNGSTPHDELPNDIRKVCNIAEKHLLMDQLFEQFVYDQTGRFKNEWDTFTSRKKGVLLVEFNGKLLAETL